MAQKVVTVYTDDLTGEETSEAATYTFALGKSEYEIDLTDKNYDKLLKALKPFMESGRRVKRGGGASTKPKRSSSTGSPETAKIREWAKAQGYEVNERGRVPANIREAYEKAH